MFGRATITLGIGPHSSYTVLYTIRNVATFACRPTCIYAVATCCVTMNPTIFDAVSYAVVDAYTLYLTRNVGQCPT